MPFDKDKKTSLKRVTLIALLMVFFALSAYIHIPLSIPITMQTFVLALCLVSVGTWVTLRMLIVYLLAGCIGIPVFSGFRSSASVLLEPSGGYLAGFFLMSLTYWVLTSVVPEFRYKKQIIMIVSLLPMYVLSVLWYAFVYLDGTGGGIISAMWVCVFPYVIPDTIKVILGCSIGERIKNIFVFHKCS